MTQKIIDALNRTPPPKGYTRDEWDTIVKEALEYIYETEIKWETAINSCTIISDILDRNNLQPEDIYTLCSMAIGSKTYTDNEEEFTKYVADKLAEGATKIGDYYAK